MATPTRLNRKHGQEFKVQGHGYKNKDDEGNASSDHNSADEDSDHETEKVSTGVGKDLVRQVMGVNRKLLQKIEILRMRLDIDRKHNDAAFQETATSYARKLTARESEIQQLQRKLDDKEKSVGKMRAKTVEKTDEVFLLQKHIDELQKEVEGSRSSANKMYAEIAMLRKEKEEKYQNMGTSGRDAEIKSLVNELNNLRKNLDTMEKELHRANDLMRQQGGRIRLLENDKKNLEVKFKEELERVSSNLKSEIGKMRDVMQKQWEEMRGLREQNVQMSSDIREIKEMLVKGREGKSTGPTGPTGADDSNSQDNNEREYRPGYLMGFQPSLPAQKGSRGRVVSRSKNKY